MTDKRQESEDTLNSLFTGLDGDGNGLIDETEFLKLLRQMDGDSRDEVASLEFALLDSDGDGFVGFREFADWWLDRNLD